MTKKDWPDWLKSAHTENAQVDIDPSGRVTWHDGEWRGGIWHDGEWHGGIWHDGEWRGGIWRDGEWRGGIWRGGIWRGGIWRDGDWLDGIWRDGDWLDGDDNPTRCMFYVRGSDNTIKVGCKTYTIAEAKALCEGGELPEEAPERNSKNGRLLRAAVLAQIAWQEALKGE